MNGIDEEKKGKSEEFSGLTPEYSGLSNEYTAEVGEPSPLVDDGKPSVHKTFFQTDEVIVPEEANNYGTAEKLRWLVLTIFLVAPFVAGAVLLILGNKIPALICFGCFVVILPIFFIIYLTKEKGAVIGRGILEQPDTKQISAQVVSCVCVARTYQYHNLKNRALRLRKLVDATYKTVITDGRKNYVAKTKIYYSPRESVNAYVFQNRAYIDPNDVQNQRNSETDVK